MFVLLCGVIVPVVLTVWQFPNRTLAILRKTSKKQQLKTPDEAKTCRHTSQCIFLS